MPLLHLKNSLNRPQQQRWLPERSTNTFLVAWLAHSWLIPLPASPTQFADCITCLANTIYWLHYLPRQHKFADCITCLANTNFVLVCTDYYFFTSLFILYFWVWICLNIFHSHVSFIFNLSIPVCSHRLSRATMDRHPKGSTLLSWSTKSNLTRCATLMCKEQRIRLSAHIHVCSILPLQNPHFPAHAPPTSHLNWSHKTPSHLNSGIKTLELTPLRVASP